MGEDQDLVLCSGQLITPESLQSRQGAVVSGSSGESSSSHAADIYTAIIDIKEEEEISAAGEEEPLIQTVECRICQEEDSIKNLESPCACSGSLKFAHRKCVQRWCNEKGDITCEICHKPYQPGYTAPPPPSHSDGTTIDISGGWTIGGTPLDLRDPRLLAMAAAERHLLEAENDEYDDTSANGAAFCRSAALIILVTHSVSFYGIYHQKMNSKESFSPLPTAKFSRPGRCLPYNRSCSLCLHWWYLSVLKAMCRTHCKLFILLLQEKRIKNLMSLLLLRHALTVGNGDGDDDGDGASTFFALFLLRAAGFLLPCYIMAWAISILQRRRQRQEAAALAAADVAFMLQTGQHRGLQVTIAAGPTVTPGPVSASLGLAVNPHQESLQ